jgi:hypothetical protein
MIMNSNAAAQAEETRRQKMELMQSVIEYTPKAVKELKTLALEFANGKQEDSDEYLNFVLENVNWVIQALNKTLDVINEQEEVIQKDKANQVILDLNEALVSGEDTKIAEILTGGFIPLLETYMDAAKKILA